MKKKTNLRFIETISPNSSPDSDLDDFFFSTAS